MRVSEVSPPGQSGPGAPRPNLSRLGEPAAPSPGFDAVLGELVAALDHRPGDVPPPTGDAAARQPATAPGPVVRGPGGIPAPAADDHLPTDTEASADGQGRPAAGWVLCPEAPDADGPRAARGRGAEATEVRTARDDGCPLPAAPPIPVTLPLPQMPGAQMPGATATPSPRQAESPLPATSPTATPAAGEATRAEGESPAAQPPAALGPGAAGNAGETDAAIATPTTAEGSRESRGTDQRSAPAAPPPRGEEGTPRALASAALASGTDHRDAVAPERAMPLRETCPGGVPTLPDRVAQTFGGPPATARDVPQTPPPLAPERAPEPPRPEGVPTGTPAPPALDVKPTAEVRLRLASLPAAPDANGLSEGPGAVARPPLPARPAGAVAADVARGPLPPDPAGSGDPAATTAATPREASSERPPASAPGPDGEPVAPAADRTALHPQPPTSHALPGAAELRGAPSHVPSHAPPPASAIATHDPGAAAARQAATALAASSDGRIELRLDPEELGRVRLDLTPGDGAITVHVAADRGETLDLMRRHADQLARELREAGYGGVTLRFGAGGGQEGSGDARHGYGSRVDHSPDARPAPQPDPAPPPSRSARSGALDLRL